MDELTPLSLLMTLGAQHNFRLTFRLHSADSPRPAARPRTAHGSP